MLAYRRTLLNVATTSDAQGNGLAMSRILKIRPEILSSTAERRVSLEATGGSYFAVHKRKGRSNVLIQDAIAMVLSWWESEIRVSPNRKDIVKLYIGRNQEKMHPLHLLFKTLVSFLILLEKYNMHFPI
jgi:hypothetical protein